LDMSCVDQLLASRTTTTTVATAPVSEAATAPPPPVLVPLQPPVEEEDEFGDFPDIEFERLMDQVSTLRQSSSSTTDPPPPPQQQRQQPQSLTLTATTVQLPVAVQQIPPHPTVLTPPQSTIDQIPDVDEFGDFPDIDVRMIDKAIATRSTQPMTRTTTTTTTISAAPSDPLTTDVVRNQKYYNDLNHHHHRTGLSFIKFSRYKVLKVHVDTTRFCKTVLVATWTDTMRHDDEDEVNIHQNLHVVVDEPRAKHCRNGDGEWFDLPPKNTNYTQAGHVQLRGQWYYTDLQEGDSIHVCSLTGQYRTDPTALPIVLHSHPPPGSEQDDLVIIHHPDLLMTPTVICETVSCPRRAVLKQRNGSTGLTATSALIGTLRHALFGFCIKEQTFEPTLVTQQIKKIVRENAEAMVGCGVTTNEAERQLQETVPVLLDFVKDHTTLLSPNQATMTPHAFVHGHIGNDKGVRFAAHATYSLEEPVVSPELALKGFVDAVMETTTMAVGNETNNDRNQHTITGLKHSLMALELKTGHNQTSQHTHMGQLSLYTLMLQGRYGVKLGSEMTGSYPSRSTSKPDPEGAASGGLLLYLNQQSAKATHVAPEFDEFKSLIGQRNITASDLLKSSKPRGIALAYQDERPPASRESKNKKIILFEPAPPAQLPDVQQSARPCTWCFENRTCMLYARSETDIDDIAGVKHTHGELLAKFTGQLHEDDLHYFRKWDRLIDLEAHASVGNTASVWLVDSQTREMSTGETISSLVFKGTTRSSEGSGVLLRFTRGTSSHNQANFDRIAIGMGSHVVVSTDGNIFDDSQSDPKMEYMNTQRERKKFRHRMNVVRGFLKGATTTDIVISASHEDLDRIQDLQDRYSKFSLDDNGDGDAGSQLLFRVDKDNSAVGVGTLRQNLINLFTADSQRGKEEPTPLNVATQRRLPRLRNFIVRLEPPTFQTVDDAALFQQPMGPPIPGCDPRLLSEEFQSLNKDQQDAVRKVCCQ
jgi:DNA replication factor Dna2